ncbi:hypothetical protein [Novosphingobium sp. ST904]|uniref:hypothetical protein n=1 Tax=Novosphingobium sp. ST904 TaxID=1684385 RepID=UPI0006C8D727|nr:hypothetical protein [Novosphingobium sp. ST904]KPH68609.1 hypothetical protein ADT71_01030 [Novosphingobium sp. ST904]TCM23033.1 hypothetical protein EDF59_1605 [Novosphingobium sp. ST904]
MARNRTERVVKALGSRIAEQGDMHIRVSRHTMKVLLRALGMGEWDEGCDDFREVDALALDMLRHLVERKL